MNTIKKQIESNKKEIAKLDNQLLNIISLESKKRIELQNKRLELQRSNLFLNYTLITG